MNAMNTAPARGQSLAAEKAVAAAAGGAPHAAAPLPAREGFAYGLLGLPLAFGALPLYVLLPNHYATEFGMPLATLGAVLLGARLFDAATDPLLGRLCDRLFARSLRAVWAAGALSALVMAAGLTGLFLPPAAALPHLAAWAAALLLLATLAFSQLGIAHQTWGARLGGSELQRGHIVAWREGCALLGVVLASALPSLFGLPVMLAVFAAALACGWLAWLRAPRPAQHVGAAAATVARSGLWHPWRNAPFRRLMAVYLLSGIAAAVPATLVLFFVQDRLRATPAQEPVFLATYFLCAALSTPLWLRAVARFGLARTWLAGMLASVAVFTAAATLGEGDIAAFMAVCALSGAALGSDLVLPGALLAGVIADAGDRGRHDGAYFGWWAFATKLNLALAAGLALPLLDTLGYTPGTREPQALQLLGTAYAAVPCVLKFAAAATLAFFFVRRIPQAPLSP